MLAPYQRIADLIIKSMQEELSAGETRELEAFSNSSASNKSLLKDLTNPDVVINTLFFMDKVNIDEDRKELEVRVAQAKKVRRIRRIKQRLSIAAVLAVLIAGAWYLWPSKTASLALLPDEESFLQLPDGRKLLLSQLADGVVNTGNLRVKKQGHQLTYTGNTTGQDQLLYHRLYVQQGKNYMVVLPDSSRIAVSESTAVKYAVRANNPERVVAVTGEAYFDVKKAGNPFTAQVVSNALDSHPQTLSEAVATGTKFSVRAYAREQQQEITLFEGALTVRSENEEFPLRSGQRITLKPNKKVIITSVEKMTRAANRRDGLFRFNDIKLQTVMEEIERWYDIKVYFSDAVRDKRITFYGDHSQSIESILQLIEDNHIKIKKEKGGKELHMSLAS